MQEDRDHRLIGSGRRLPATAVTASAAITATTSVAPSTITASTAVAASTAATPAGTNAPQLGDPMAPQTMTVTVGDVVTFTWLYVHNVYLSASEADFNARENRRDDVTITPSPGISIHSHRRHLYFICESQAT